MPDDPTRGAEYVYEALVDAGIEHLIGLPGTQTLPLDRIVASRDEMEYVMARHETAIPHIAWGYYESSDTPAATLTVPGPGDTNAMHGLKNAANDCVPIVHVSADIDPADRGKDPIHEIESDTFDNAVKANVTVERPIELTRQVARGIEIALTPPTGPVRLGIPSGILADEVDAPDATVSPECAEYDNADAYDRGIAALAGAERPAIYVGGGARRSTGGAAVVRELARELNAPVIASHKGKGVFPEDDPRFVGVTGGFFPAGGRRMMDRADVVLALGNDLDLVTTMDGELPLGDTLVHVNLDPGDIDAVYPADVAIVDDAAAAGEALLEGLRDHPDRASAWEGSRIGAAVRKEYRESLRDRGLFDGGSPANTPALLTELRSVVPRDAIVVPDVGGFRLWAMEVFEAYEPRDFIAAGSWAGMGVGLPGAIGAGLANPDRSVVCLTGDGGLMMCVHELHTAAEQDLDLTIVVSNNRDYGIISKSPKIRAYLDTDEHEFTWETPIFEAIATGFGCRGTTVETAADAADAVAEAVGQPGPDVIDVAVETKEPSAAEAAEYESTVDLG